MQPLESAVILTAVQIVGGWSVLLHSSWKQMCSTVVCDFQQEGDTQVESYALKLHCFVGG